MSDIFNLKSAKNVMLSAIIALFISVIMILIFASISLLWSTSEKICSSSVVAITILSNCIGGFISAKLNKIRGLIFGFFTGILYFLILYVISCFVGIRADFSAVCISTVVFSVTAAALGGVLGININKSSKKKK